MGKLGSANGGACVTNKHTLFEFLLRIAAHVGLWLWQVVHNKMDQALPVPGMWLVTFLLNKKASCEVNLCLLTHPLVGWIMKAVQPKGIGAGGGTLFLAGMSLWYLNKKVNMSR
jgi:hypothetical protein